MQKVLVTGGAGFIGSHVVDYLINKGCEVTVLDDLSGGFLENVNPKAKFVQGSVTDYNLVCEVVKGKEVVYHLAAYAAEGLSHNIRRFNYHNNLMGSINLVNASIKENVKRFVFASSIAVYGAGNGTPPFKEEDAPHPEDPYGTAKLAVEHDLISANLKFGLDYTIIRPYNVYGERQFLGDPYRNVMGIFMNNLMKGKAPQIFGDGKQRRAFTYIGDVAHCIAEAGFNQKAANQVINLGASKDYSVNEIAEEVIKAMTSDLSEEHVPPRVEVKYAWCDNSRAKTILGYEDRTSIQEGIRRMAEWAKKKGPMDPIIWERVEIDKNLPDSWRKLPQLYPNAEKRINPDII